MSRTQVWTDRFSTHSPLFIPPTITSASEPSLLARSTAPVRLLVCQTDHPQPEASAGFATALAARLGAETVPISAESTLPPINSSTDLLLYNEPPQSRLTSWIFGPPACFKAAQWPASLLVVRQPRPALRNILLISRGQARDMAAAEWMARLAIPAETRVMVLAVQPALSGVDSQALYNDGLTGWLNSQTPLGDQLRKIARRLNHSQIDPLLSLTILPGQPHRQIKQAVTADQPDLIMISADPANWYERRLLGELVDPLLRWADRPVLIAKQ